MNFWYYWCCCCCFACAVVLSSSMMVSGNSISISIDASSRIRYLGAFQQVYAPQRMFNGDDRYRKSSSLGLVAQRQPPGQMKGRFAWQSGEEPVGISTEESIERFTRQSFTHAVNRTFGKIGKRMPTALSLSPSAAAAAALEKDDQRVSIERKIWMFQDKYPIAYEVATSAVAAATIGQKNGQKEEVELVPILLLNGFGVGSFHQHRLMDQILIQHNQQQQSKQKSQTNRQYVIYGVDYLGQGSSWPEDCQDGFSPDEHNLSYSANMWLDQITNFIQGVILNPSTYASGDVVSGSAMITHSYPKLPTKLHLVGNSVGGYLSAILASSSLSSSPISKQIASISLLNATPIWGLNLPFWDGRLPPPSIPKYIGRRLFDVIRDENVISKYLDVAYYHQEAHDGTFPVTPSSSSSPSSSLGSLIRACTEGTGGHAAFASILWSPPAMATAGTTDLFLDKSKNYELDIEGEIIGFYDALKNISCDVLLLFGSDDPWCTPAIAKRMHSTLINRRHSIDNNEDGFSHGNSPTQRYVALENVGHCPNHEAPTAVANVLLRWLDVENGATKATILTAGSGATEKVTNSATKSVTNGNAHGEAMTRHNVPLVPNAAVQVSEPWGNVGIREVSPEESNRLEGLDWIVSFVAS